MEFSSFILKVKAAEITASGMIGLKLSERNTEKPTDQYHLGFTMRFPRALAIREDLSVADCMTSTGKIIGH